MYELIIKDHFSAAHQIPQHPGKCKNIHGHNWEVEVSVLVRDLDEIGMSVDFSHLKRALGEIVGRFDHVNLNDLVEFSGDPSKNPTVENIARVIYENMETQIEKTVADLSKVTLRETNKNACVYFK